MSLITTLEHGFAVAAQDIVRAGRIITGSVLPILQKAEANSATIEAVTGLVSPAAANIERTAFAVLGLAIKAIEDAGTAAAAGGMSVSLDAALVADLKAILPTIKASATKPAA